MLGAIKVDNCNSFLVEMTNTERARGNADNPKRKRHPPAKQRHFIDKYDEDPDGTALTITNECSRDKRLSQFEMVHPAPVNNGNGTHQLQADWTINHR